MTESTIGVFHSRLTCVLVCLLVLPGMAIAEDAAGVTIEFRLAEVAPGEGLAEMEIAGTERRVHVRSQAVLTNDDIATALAVRRGAEAVIEVKFTSAGAKELASLTENRVGMPIAVFVNGRLVSAPIVQAPIRSGVAVIRGNLPSEAVGGIAGARDSAGGAFEPVRVLTRRAGVPKTLGLVEAAGSSVSVHLQPEAGSAVVWVGEPGEIESREHSYEEIGAVVTAIETRGGERWFRVELADGKTGWLGPEAAGTYYPLEELVEQNLSYLNRSWDRVLCEGPGTGSGARRLRSEVRRKMGREVFAEVVGSQRADGRLWLEVEVMSGSPCEGEEPTVLGRGWLPAYDESGEPVAWYYSRGC